MPHKCDSNVARSLPHLLFGATTGLARLPAPTLAVFCSVDEEPRVAAAGDGEARNSWERRPGKTPQKHQTSASCGFRVFGPQILR